MSRRFNKFGLRRDRNFADIPNPTQALNNLLNGLVDVEGESFVSTDLDPIKDIRTTTIENQDFRNITGAALRVTNEETRLLEVYKPVVKFKNRLDVARFTVGEPFLFGGDGLTTRYYEGDQLNSTSSTLEGIFIGEEKAKEVFWERGIFDFISKIRDDLQDIYGGVQWDGFFKPNQTGNWRFGVRSSSFFTIEFDDGNGNLVLRKRKSQYEYTFQVNAADEGATTLTLSDPANAINLLENDVLIHASIPQFEDPDAEGSTALPVTIDSINATTGVITLSSPLDEAITAPTNFIFRFSIGEGTGRFTFTAVNLEEFKPYKVRYRYWIPDIPQVNTRIQKTISFTVTTPTSATSQYLNYRWLYNEDYDLNPDESSLDFGDFRKFFNARLGAGGGTVGGNAFPEYQNIVSKSPFSVTYDPPTELALGNAITQTKSVTASSSSPALGMSITDNIEVGNYVFGNRIADGTRVERIATNTAVFLDQLPTSDGSTTVTFINHRGLVAFDSTTTYINGAVTITGVNATGISVGDIVINAHTQPLTVITRISGTTITVSKPLTGAGTNVRTFFYKANGLYNESLATFCSGVVAAPTALQSNAGTNTLRLAYLDGLSTGMVVQFGTRVAPGTTITNINSGTRTITLSSNLTDDIPFGQLVVFAPSGTTDNKEICFPPLDTSPPFIATPVGLTTTSARPTIDIRPTSGTSEIKFVGLSADGVTVTATTPTANYNRGLTITDINGVQYRILAVAG